VPRRATITQAMIWILLLLRCSESSDKVIVLPKNPSKMSKYVPEGQQPNAVTDALDKVRVRDEISLPLSLSLSKHAFRAIDLQ
jgi:hypothetical protein